MNGREILRLTGVRLGSITRKWQPITMRWHLILLLLMAMLVCTSGGRIKASTNEIAVALADGSPSSISVQSDSVKRIFETKIKPILTARCQPCHFAGGKMYAKLPFDDPKTIRMLGVKLFTRITDQKEQTILRAFLSAAPDTAAAGATPQQ